MSLQDIPKAIVSDKYLRSFGRVKGRVLSRYQLNLIEEIFPKVKLNLEDLSCLEDKNICLEIGFGTGDFLNKQIRNNPSNFYIGCEPFINGIANFLSKVSDDLLNNFAIFHGDVRILLEHLPNNILNDVYILFPDPWAKTRQNKKRLINEILLNLLSLKMKDRSRLLIATDDIDYSKNIKDLLTSSEKFQLESNNYSQNPPNSWTSTKYQNKAIAENRKTRYFYVFCNK